MKIKMIGIYKITNTVNGKFYIGSSTDLKRRLSGHRQRLNKGNHVNKRLQYAWNKYGEENFSFGIIEAMEKADEILWREQYWIDHLDAINKGYNIAELAGSAMLGLKHTSEARQKISEAGRKRIFTEETRLKIRLAQLGQKRETTEAMRLAGERRRGKPGHKWSEEDKVKMSERMVGVKMSDEAKRNMSLAKKGFVISLEHRKKLSEALKGRSLTDEHKAKVSSGNRGKIRSAEVCAMIGNLKRGTKHSEETKTKMSAAHKGRKKDPEVHRKMWETRRKNKLLVTHALEKENPAEAGSDIT